MVARDREPSLFAPKTRGWIAGPTYDLGEKEFRVLWDDLIIGMKFGDDPKVRKAYSVKQGNMYIELPNRSRVEVRSSDHPDTLVGEGLDWLIVSEAAKHAEGIWEKYLRPALADKRGSADFPTTPEGQNWLYRLWQLGQNPKFVDYESWNFPSWLNTAAFPGGLNDPEIIAVKATTNEQYFEQEYGAKPTSFIGKILSDFDESRHVKPHRFIPAWPNYIAFDWGFTNPFAAIEFQVSPRDEIFVWREYYEPGKTLGQHVEVLKARENPEGYHLDMGFGDAADPAAALEMTINYVATAAEPDAKTNWREGIDLLSSFLKDIETGNAIDEYGTPEKAPRFFIDPDCKQFIHEVNNYRQKAAPKTGTDPGDGAKKKDDHGIDALRYALMHLFKLGYRSEVGDLARVNPHMFRESPMPVYDANNRALAPVGTQSGTSAMAELMGLYVPSDAETIFNFGEERAVF